MSHSIRTTSIRVTDSTIIREVQHLTVGTSVTTANKKKHLDEAKALFVLYSEHTLEFDDVQLPLLLCHLYYSLMLCGICGFADVVVLLFIKK